MIHACGTFSRKLRDARKHLRSCPIHRKSLMLTPQKLAVAFVNDGWILRSDIVVQKNNPAADGVHDRPCRHHEYLYLLTRNDDYYFDPDPLRVPYLTDRQTKFTRHGTPLNQPIHPSGKLRGSVWTIGQATGAGDHPAPMSLQLAMDCVRAGCPVDGIVLDPFVGSGTSLVAAVENQRHGIGIDLLASLAAARQTAAADGQDCPRAKFCSGDV